MIQREKFVGADIYCGSAKKVLRQLPDQSVQMGCTSPPYFAQRDYGVDGQVGLETTPDKYIRRLVGIFREFRRVLRDDGVLFVNIADTYAGGGRGGGSPGSKQQTNKGSLIPAFKIPKGFKRKDRMGIPHLFAFAMREDGWYFRDEIVWHKQNAMPLSITDRTGCAHEFIFMFSKSEKYFYDHIRIQEKSKYPGDDRGARNDSPRIIPMANSGGGVTAAFSNKRSVWKVPVANNNVEHFAAYPPALILPCIRAGTSKHGACSECGAPFKRVVTKERIATRPGKVTKTTGKSSEVTGNRDPKRHVTSTKTTGWEQSCSCITRVYTRDNNYLEEVPDPKPCVVLDPFGGTGTTGAVAIENGCYPILIELNPEYIPFIRNKLRKAQRGRGFGL